MTVAAASSGRFRHSALFYRGPGEYLAALGDFIRASRARGGAVFIAVPGLKARLVRRELGTDSAQAALVDMAELGRNPARIIPAVLAYAGQHRGQHVCCIGEPIWPGRTAAEMQEATRHEALTNLAFRDSPVTVICLYDRTGLPGTVVADAVSTHPAVIRDGKETASAGYLVPPDLPPRCRRPLLRGFVATRAKRAGLAPARISDLVLAASELAGNTLRHTGSGGTLQVWRTREEIICQVTDTGQITDPLAWHRAPSDELLGGNGLWLVNQVCDLVQTRTSQAGTTVRLHMGLNRR
jgi:anti-sigma regulatory factor (Ser/Thr protein kinase)